ncbi:MAG: bifunctional 4-hydroxy-2-oxoglutarate aldolase/2-dehydro-3-deoxy-phosphogluconate aldolase [Clostridia bacterium]|nr:bifunctional 4-hydroxy-2-oxoglutarate aldolase/2-dehydro-3-deoxy-phosphogluconate aldolase [Clostridia bacterium]
MDTLGIIKESKLIAIARGLYGSKLIEASLALYRGGVRAFEVTFEQDKSIGITTDAISRLTENLPADAVIGAGTVLSRSQVDEARNAGARFIISPNTDKAVIELTKQSGMVSIPGAMTPTEIVNAHTYGADIVKLFPAGVLGLEYFKAVRAPLAHIPLAAVAGITINNIRDFYNAGAVAFGISSTLYNKKSIAESDYNALIKTAQRFYEVLNLHW